VATRTVCAGSRSPGGRVLQVADIYDALTTVRPYKPVLDQQEALDVLTMEASRGWRDPSTVSAFVELHRNGLTADQDSMFFDTSQLQVLCRSVAGNAALSAE